MTDRIDLHCHSTFSLLDGFGSPKAVVARAKNLGWSAVSLTEHGTLMSAPALYKAARAEKIKPILGCEFYVTPDFAFGEKGKELLSEQFHLTVLALSREGYENLVAWSTEAMQRENFYRKPRISVFRMAEIAPWPLHHNVVLSGCIGGELCQSIMHNQNGAAAADYVNSMKMIFPSFYIEIQDHFIDKYADEAFPAYVKMLFEEVEIRERLITLAEKTNTPLVLTNDSHMQSAADRKAHVAMKASAWRTRDDQYTSSERLSAAYVTDYTYFANYMRNMEVVGARVPEQALTSIEEIVQAVDIRLDPLDNFSYSIPNSGYDDPMRRMRMRSKTRLQELISKHGPKARERFEYEIESIGDFAHYLLLISDFIIAARKQGILTWTRGSAASSLLCYCLKIHEIDPIEHELIFSRFFNPARKKLPDIDIDIQPSRYEDFMQIVHEKMEPLVGEGQVVQICNYGTAANRSAFRMAASALGIEKEEQDEISKLLPQMIDSGMVDEDTDVFTALKEEYPDLYEIASSIFDSIKSISQHACAWAFGTPERPLKTWVPMYLIASSNTLVTQFDFKSLEDFGLVKGDFLRLKTLDIAADTLRMVGRSPLDFFTLPLDDEPTYKMIQAGHVDGVHTLQGKEVRRGVIDMQAENIFDLTLAAALYRPANTRPGKDKVYVKRRRGEDDFEYSHEILERILGPTLGLPIFQEQAMEIGYAVGMDDAGVDDIYQAIKKAKGVGRGAKEAFAEIEPIFMKAAEETVGELAREFWDWVQQFSGYSFNRAHAASYGVLAGKMAYLKCHYPAEFFAALLDNFPERSQYLAAAREEGYNFSLPDINRSHAGFGIDKGKNAIRTGIGKVYGLGPVAVSEIVTGQPFSSLDDLKARTTRRSLNVTRLENLAKLGVLEPLGIPREKDEDLLQFQLLGFTLKKPGKFKGVKPKHHGPRTSESGWKHLGLVHGLESTQGRASVSKLFWIPPGVKLELKASPWANVKTWLFEMVDENGVKFHCLGNQDKPDIELLMKFLHKKCQDRVVCLDGMVRLPFVMNGPQGFRLFGVTGSFSNDPQVFPGRDSDMSYIAAAQSRKLRRF
jgi:DNA polymerase III subunit alpha